MEVLTERFAGRAERLNALGGGVRRLAALDRTDEARERLCDLGRQLQGTDGTDCATNGKSGCDSWKRISRTRIRHRLREPAALGKESNEDMDTLKAQLKQLRDELQTTRQELALAKRNAADTAPGPRHTKVERDPAPGQGSRFVPGATTASCADPGGSERPLDHSLSVEPVSGTDSPCPIRPWLLHRLVLTHEMALTANTGWRKWNKSSWNWRNGAASSRSLLHRSRDVTMQCSLQMQIAPEGHNQPARRDRSGGPWRELPTTPASESSGFTPVPLAH